MCCASISPLTRTLERCMASPVVPPSEFVRKCRPRRGGNFKHGMSDSRLESIREKMIERCHNPNATNFHRYGGKGIAVCEEWRNDAGSFYRWALANGYRDDLQIDREKNHLGYSPENCKWSTHEEQQNNRGNNSCLTVAGQKITASAFARLIGFGKTARRI